jgi:PAS domain S-box-containing protein
MQNEEMKRARAEAEKLHGKFVDLYDYAPVGYFTIDPQGTVCEVNLTGCHILGMERQKVTGQKFQAFLEPGSISAFTAFCKSVPESTEKEACEVELVRDDHERFFAQIQGSGLPEKDQEPGWIRMVLSDITDRKPAEEDPLHYRHYNHRNRHSRERSKV